MEFMNSRILPRARKIILSTAGKTSNVPHAHCIHLKQVEVYDSNGINWAASSRGAIASQSSTHKDMHAINIINEDYSNCNHTSSSDKFATVTIELPHEIEVSRVKVVSLKNSEKWPHGDRLEGTLIKLEDDQGRITSEHRFSRTLQENVRIG